jgi:hypothetical protein
MGRVSAGHAKAKDYSHPVVTMRYSKSTGEAGFDKQFLRYYP